MCSSALLDAVKWPRVNPNLVARQSEHHRVACMAKRQQVEPKQVVH